MLNYSVYKTQNEKNKVLRETLLKKILLTNQIIEVKKPSENKNIKIKDPDNILKTWEDTQDDKEAIVKQ